MCTRPRGAQAVSEASAHPPGASTRSSFPPSRPAGGSGRPPWARPQENEVSALGASTLLPGRWRGAAPPSHPVFVRGAGGHCVRARNGGPGSPPTSCPGPLGNSKTTSGVCGGSPEYSRSERPGGGLSEIRSQIRRCFPLPCLSTLKGHLNRERKRERKKGGITLNPHLRESSPGSQ